MRLILHKQINADTEEDYELPWQLMGLRAADSCGEENLVFEGPQDGQQYLALTDQLISVQVIPQKGHQRLRRDDLDRLVFLAKRGINILI